MSATAPNFLEKGERDSSPDKLPVYRPHGRAVGVLFEDVSVFGAPAGATRVSDLPAILNRIVRFPAQVARQFVGNRPTEATEIVRNISGVVKPGETLLVLGRPGAGCSTTLKVLGNDVQSFLDVRGNVTYSTMSSSEMAGSYGSEIVYNDEDDMHFPRLSVDRTLKFGLSLRKPAAEKESDAEFSGAMVERILKALGISHTSSTIVGSSFVRGVSGGERKRVSLAEVLATNPAVAAWDNPIRGLDSSSALSFLRLLKALSRQTGMSNIVTLYQASEAMYRECFDRVLVLYEGRMIYNGPADQAKQYFVDLGFQCHERQTTPDFLTTITSPEERMVREDHLGPVPLDPDAFADAFKKSASSQALQDDMNTYRTLFASDSSIVAAFRDEARRVKSRLSLNKSLEPRSIIHQTIVAVRRYYQLLWGDRSMFLMALFLNVVNAVLNGSAYYMAPKTAVGSFEKGGALFFSLIYFFLNALTEVSSTVNSRNILLKQHKLGFIHPVAYILAQTVADIPVALFQTLVFSGCYYFMLGLIETAAKFWTFLVIVFVHYLAATGLFRMLGAWSPNLSIALLLAGASLPVSLIYSGYGPPIPTVHRWGSWIRWIAPAPYALEALMGNEFSDITLHCTASQLVPSGPGYGDIRYQGCTLPGSVKGSAEVPGAVYLAEEYSFYSRNMWRNLGIVIVLWIIYALLTAVGLTIMTRENGHSGGRVYKRGAHIPNMEGASQVVPKAREVDLENQSSSVAATKSNSSSSKASSVASSKISPGFPGTAENSPRNASDGTQASRGAAFAFENVNYFVGEKQLLNNVCGYAQPGQLTALMGASGAGKTTLLDVISQRKSEGRVEGQMLFDGRALDKSFGRACGFCMQQDVHEPTTTVREALQFSALLRQPAQVSQKDKNAYVEHVISLLDLEAIADAIVGSPGDGGLSVEERKRVTIGVELAARPSALLFLNEPTSGLDSQAAYSLVSFLRKIAAEGIPIICTIHQPSGVIFEMFDHVLLLAPGGRTVYFGETGHNSHHVVDYFARYGAVMDNSDNPAEFILSTVTNQVQGDSSRDWYQTWLESPEQLELSNRISALNSSARHPQDLQKLGHDGEFALPLALQIVAVTKRHWIAVWRSGFYNFSRLVKAAFNELFIAFTYFHVTSDVQGLQNYMLSLLILSWIIPATAADIQDVWFERWAIFEAREKNGIYDWKALAVALIVVELPWQIVFFTVAFFCSYWTVGFPNTTAVAGYQYFMFILFSLFGTGFPQLMAALFPNSTLSGYANSLFWVLLLMFSGTIVPHSAMPEFYRPWLFWADPLRYFFAGSSANVLHGVEVHCSEKDLTIFDPPEGKTCYEYAGSYLASNPGYLTNPNATTDCAHCRFSIGDEYAQSLDYYYGDRWRDLAVLLGFCLTTFLLTFIVTGLTHGRKRKALKT